MKRLPPPSGFAAMARPVAALVLMFSLGVDAQASLFDDNEARRAILELRQRFEALQQRQSAEQQRQSADQQRQSAEQQRLITEQQQRQSAEQQRLITEQQRQSSEQQRQSSEQQRQSSEQQRQSSDQQRLIDAVSKNILALDSAAEENKRLRISLLGLANQIEQVRADLSHLRGQNELIAREVSEVQRRLKDVSNDVEERFRRMEPTKVTVDGQDFLASPAEIRDFETALSAMRKSDFARAQSAFTAFLQRHSGSGYQASALFWLGNAQYAVRNFKESLASLRAMLVESPRHVFAPDAMLAVANALVELKEPLPEVRRSLEDLVRIHPRSEAARVASNRLSELK